MRLIRGFQIVLVVIPVALFAWLLWLELVPTGTFVVSRAVDERSPFVDQLLPDQRVDPVARDEEGDLAQRLTGDPVFFFVHPHRQFDAVELEVWFKNTGVPIVELGGLAQAGEEEIYDLYPLDNRLIDLSPLEKIRDGEVVLLQRRKVYANLENFFANPPPVQQIAVYQDRIEQPFPLPKTSRGPVRLLGNVDLDASGINYILARYEPPQRVGTWLVKTITFDPKMLKPNPQTWKFVFSVPESDERQGMVSVGKINVTFRREPLTAAFLWQTIRERTGL